MSAAVSQITGVLIVYSTVYSCADQIKNQSSASLAFVRRIHLWPVNSPHRGSVTRKVFSFDRTLKLWSATYSVFIANSLVLCHLMSWFLPTSYQHQFYRQAHPLVIVKMSSYRYRNSHYKDKTASRPSYEYNDGMLQLCEPVWTDCAVFNTLRPRRNEQHFADDIFKRIFFNENIWISIEISLKFVSKGPINNIPALVQIMAWRRSGDKPLSKPMMVSLLTLICVTRPQWVNVYYGYRETYGVHHW